MQGCVQMLKRTWQLNSQAERREKGKNGGTRTHQKKKKIGLCFVSLAWKLIEAVSHSKQLPATW